MTKSEAEEYLADPTISETTLEVEGAYNRLIANDRRDGSIPAALDSLARLCKVSRRRMESVIWPVISGYFVEFPGNPARLLSPVNEALRSKDNEKSDAQRMRAKMRWQSRGNAGDMPQDMPRHEPGSAVASDPASTGHTEPPKKEEFPPHTPLSEEKITPGSLARGREKDSSSYSEEFEAFWNEYPRKEAKGAAYKAWRKINPSARLIELILAGVERWKGSRLWQDKEFIAHPSTWLNESRWDDEPQGAANGRVCDDEETARMRQYLPPTEDFSS